MKKFFSKSALLLCFAAIAFIFSGCCGHDDDPKIETTPSAEGTYTILNKTTGQKEEMTVLGTSITSNSALPFIARNGDVLSFEFKKAEKNAKYSFDTTFTLHNGEEIKNQNPYEYTITDTEPGTYSVSIYANILMESLTRVLDLEFL